MTNQCQHGQLARVCLICEQAAEIERLTATVAGLRESANLRVRYHAAELADVTAERDEAREQVEIYGAERDEARAAWSNRTRELERMEAQVAGLTEGLEKLREALLSHQVYIRALCRAVDAATDFAGTVAGGASWWDEVWAEHTAELDATRAALKGER